MDQDKARDLIFQQVFINRSENIVRLSILRTLINILKTNSSDEYLWTINRCEPRMKNLKGEWYFDINQEGKNWKSNDNSMKNQEGKYKRRTISQYKLRRKILKREW